jgi:hypothetical protein
MVEIRRSLEGVDENDLDGVSRQCGDHLERVPDGESDALKIDFRGMGEGYHQRAKQINLYQRITESDRFITC